jgi:hypothetical protein
LITKIMWRLFNMKKYKGFFIILICLTSTLFFEAMAFNQGDGKGKKSQTNFLQKTADDPVSSILDINNITSWITADGYWPSVWGGDGWNGSYPKGLPTGVDFQEGLVWGGLVNDGGTEVLRVGGNTYFPGTTRLQRLFRVRPDYATADLTDDAANFNLVDNSAVTPAMISELRTQYAKDWNEWPWQSGAPYEDVNHDGVYEPNIDIPGIPGASQTIFVRFNDASSVSAYGSEPIGLTVNETVWAYAIANPLNNISFRKAQVIYTGLPGGPSNAEIDTMYLVQWCDFDIGNAGDDFAGCDSTLGLGYCYNATSHDAYFDAIGTPPPAAGFDFFQGVSQYTGNPADSAVFNLKYRHGYKYTNLNSQGNPMTTFVYFAAGGAWSDPSGQSYTGSQEWYSLMRGYQPQPWPTKKLFPTNVSGVDVGGDGTYLLPGDPVTHSGWVDGEVEGAGDRRVCLETGPFNLKLGDTVEVVTALIAGTGADNLSSISVLKFYDKFAQYAYDQLFNLPNMPTPQVSVTALDGGVLLNWANEGNISKIENTPHAGYDFEGYNVYQLPSSSADLSSAKRIATYDMVDNITTVFDDQFDITTGAVVSRPVFFGSDNGISRTITIKKDVIRGNVPMVDGTDYYFAVTAVGYNGAPDAPFHILESSPVALHVVPQLPNPGVRYTSSSGDTLKVTHNGTSDGKVVPIVIDPTKTNGHNYKVTFDSTGSWSLTDITANTIDVTNTNQSGDNNYVVINGIQTKVLGPPPGVKPDPDGWSIPQGTRRFTFAGGAGNFGFEAFSGALGYASPYTVFGGGTNPIPPTALHNVLLVLAQVPDGSVDFGPTFNASDTNMSYGYRYGRGFASAAADPRFAPYIINAVGGYSFQDFTKNVPLSAWNVDDPAHPVRLALGWLENNVANGLVDGKYWPPDYNNYDNTASSGPREWLFIMDTPYSTTPDPNLEEELTSNPVPVMYFCTWARRGAVPFSPDATGEDQFEIFPTRPNSVADSFTFTAPTVTFSNDLAKQDVNMINVFPNPYYGFNSRETTRSGKYVTFSHLPQQAKIRIFDLAGHQVAVLNKDDQTQFINWNLLNDHNYPIASGLYIVYIDMPSLGTTKILKLAVVQEQQILQTY